MKSITQLQQQIRDIQNELASLGAMRPGNLAEQYNVCGSPGCHCKDPKHPVKHGPYWNLKYTHNGKARTEFVKADAVADVRIQLENYKRFRELCAEWVDMSLEVARLSRAGH